MYGGNGRVKQVKNELMNQYQRCCTYSAVIPCETYPMLRREAGGSVTLSLLNLANQRDPCEVHANVIDGRGTNSDEY